MERPRSLVIQRTEDIIEDLDQQIIRNVESEVHFDDVVDYRHDDLDKIKEEQMAASKHVHPLTDLDPPSLGSEHSDNRDKSPNSLTAQGFFDLKFYHSRLW